MSNRLFNAFVGLFLALDGDQMERPDVTRACVSALFDRMLNPGETEEDLPTASDVANTVRALTAMIEAEAESVRSELANVRPRLAAPRKPRKQQARRQP